jgi:hypothetical protein
VTGAQRATAGHGPHYAQWARAATTSGALGEGSGSSRLRR